MRRIRPDDLPWTEPREGVRCKSMIHDGRKVRVVEFSEGFGDADCCCEEHIGFVLNGRLEVVFADNAEVFSPGDIVMIGKGDKHRARVVEGPVRLFLVEEA